LSCVSAASVYGGDFRTRSGGPYSFANCQPVGSGNTGGGGMSFGSPIGVPDSTQRTIVLTWSSVRLRSFLNSRMPTFLSMCHGGITRADTRALIALRTARVRRK
jgi:hypothetical protein